MALYTGNFIRVSLISRWALTFFFTYYYFSVEINLLVLLNKKIINFKNKSIYSSCIALKLEIFLNQVMNRRERKSGLGQLIIKCAPMVMIDFHVLTMTTTTFCKWQLLKSSTIGRQSLRVSRKTFVYLLLWNSKKKKNCTNWWLNNKKIILFSKDNKIIQKYYWVLKNKRDRNYLMNK